MPAIRTAGSPVCGPRYTLDGQSTVGHAATSKTAACTEWPVVLPRITQYSPICLPPTLLCHPPTRLSVVFRWSNVLHRRTFPHFKSPPAIVKSCLNLNKASSVLDEAMSFTLKLFKVIKLNSRTQIMQLKIACSV